MIRFCHRQCWHLAVPHLLHLRHLWEHLVPIQIPDFHSIAMAYFHLMLIPPLFKLHFQVWSNHPPNDMHEYVYHYLKTLNNNLLYNLMGVV